MNNIAVAFFLAGLLQPILLWLQQGRTVSPLGVLVSLLFLATAAMLAWTAQAVVRRLED